MILLSAFPHFPPSLRAPGRLVTIFSNTIIVDERVELAEQGKDFSALLDAAEMAFRFQNVEDDEESAIKDNTPEMVKLPLLKAYYGDQ